MGNENKIYYKVVTEDLKSAIVYDIERLSTQYIKNEFVETKNKGMGLLVYDDLKFAKRYLENVGHCDQRRKLFKCACIEELNLHINFALTGWPTGTRSFKQVKLLEEIKIQ